MKSYLIGCCLFSILNIDNGIPLSNELNISKNRNVSYEKFILRAQTVTQIQSWSMVVAVIEDAFPKKWTCSGVLVSVEHVVTAAHCLTNIFRNGCREPLLTNFKVKIGFLNLNDADIPNQRESFGLTAYHIPNGFNGCSFDLAVASGRDIAVVKLDRKVPQSFFDNKFASKVGLFSAPEYEKLDIRIPLNIVGYGKDETGFYGVLRNGSTFIFDRQTCLAERKKLVALVEKSSSTSLPWDSLCTTRQSILCDGDSGAPLLLQYSDGAYGLIGVAIQTAGCTADSIQLLSNAGDVFTRIDLHKSWIDEIIQNST